ncbi:MAG: hypothetical protein ACK5TI_01855 [bacterium]
MQPAVACFHRLAGCDRTAARGGPWRAVRRTEGGRAANVLASACGVGRSHGRDAERRDHYDLAQRFRQHALSRACHHGNSRRSATDTTWRLKSNRAMPDRLRVSATSGVIRQPRAGT